MATTENQRDRLALAGMVRIDGLTACRGDERILITSRLSEAGHWDTNNGKLAMITADNEIWLGRHDGSDPLSHGGDSVRRTLIQELCNVGRGVFVPCSNGEALRDNDIMDRLLNPDWQPR